MESNTTLLRIVLLYEFGFCERCSHRSATVIMALLFSFLGRLDPHLVLIVVIGAPSALVSLSE